MTQHRRKQLLWVINVLLAASLAAVVAASFLSLPDATPLSSGDKEPPVTVAAAPRPVEPLSKYAVIYERDLRKPLFDVASPVAVAGPETAAAASFNLRLTGTVVEPGRSYGLFRTPAGETKLAGVGETIEGAEVTAVTEVSTTLRFHGKEVTLKVEKEDQPAIGKAPRRPATPRRTLPAEDLGAE